jgi:hypothetical protein
MKDRRATRRYELSLPVIVRSVDASGNGRTSNMSTHGVYFTTSDDLRVGAKRNLTMILPVEVTGGDSEVLVQAISRIVRIEKRSNGDQIGVAAQIERCEIVRNNERSEQEGNRTGS